MSKLNIILFHILAGRDNVVSTCFRYELQHQGIESRLGARISAPVQTETLAHPTSNKMGNAKRPGRGVNPPSSSNEEVKERIELYIYFPLRLRDKL